MSAIVSKRIFCRLFPNNSKRERHLFESLFKENRASKQLQVLLQWEPSGVNRKVSLNVKDATIAQTMQQLLGGMDLAYKKEQDNVIVLIRKAQDKSITP